jgi:hypothetical protein
MEPRFTHLPVIKNHLNQDNSYLQTKADTQGMAIWL